MTNYVVIVAPEPGAVAFGAMVFVLGILSFGALAFRVDAFVWRALRHGCTRRAGDNHSQGDKENK